MRPLVRTWAAAAFVVASTGCAADKSWEGESDVTAQTPAHDPATASDVTVRKPAAGDAGSGPAETAADASVAPAASASSGDYSLIACADAVAPTGPAYPACDGPVRCGGEAQCVPIDVLAAGAGAARAEMFPECSTGKCVPTAFRQGKFRFKPCTGELGDGRCVARCAALTRNPLASILSVGAFGCGREEVCAPCAVEGTANELCATDMCAE